MIPLSELEETGLALIAFSKGKKIQSRNIHWSRNSWADVALDSSMGMEPILLHQDTRLRIKPEYRKRPMWPEEFPPVFWVKQTSKEGSPWLLVVGVSELYLTVLRGDLYLSTAVGDGYEWSPDRKEMKSFFVEDNS